MSNLVMPELNGTREGAVDLTSSLPDDLRNAVVSIDAGAVVAAAQSFADELCKQILEVRHASRLEVHCATPRFAGYLSSSARVRGLSDRLSVDVKPR
jgi:hypothetical protein